MAASTVCNTLSKNVASRKCLVSGGIKNRAWVLQAGDFTGAETFNSDGALSSFGLATDAKVITATGRPKKGSGASKFTKGEDTALAVDQSVVLEFSYNSQPELDAITAFLKADNTSVFLETNAKTIRQYFPVFGATGLEGEDSTGTNIGDAANVLKVTLKGTEGDLPRFFESAISGQLTQLASSIAYLDALVTGN